MKIKQPKNIILIFAHPDDDTFCCSGTTIQSARSGDNITLICATRGEEGETGDPPVCEFFDLGDQREKETKNAAKFEGIKKVYFLGLRDNTLEHFSIRFLASLLTPYIRKIKPDILVTFALNGLSGHGVHVAISKAVTNAYHKEKINNNRIMLWYATIPESVVTKMRKEGMVRDIFKRPFKGLPDKDITLKIGIKNVLAEKIRALKYHRSQHHDWERWIKRSKSGYLGYEYYSVMK